MKDTEKKRFPIGPEHYELFEEVGTGVSASVHRARCMPLNEIVAIKILDFERDNCDLNNISREALTMILIDHPNVLKSHCSFVSDHNLWVVMPYMSGGSCLHILKAAYPDGFEEVVIATILREVLKGLEYLHHHGHIHRDVKAGNILIDSRGAIKLGDFGVSACLFDSGDRQRTRNTFVGTPCWMAPEVMEQLHGYDFKADIWSFGITALELAHGHAPFSKYPPMKVLLMTLQNAPPGLDYERDRKFSKSFKQMIASCLVKDPSKRPTASKLLKNSFFKQARSNDYIARTLLEGLPALGDRMKALKRKEEDMLAQKQMPDGQMEELSQNEYKRGISGWNFNLEDMKAQASLIQDYDESESSLGGSSTFSTIDAPEKQSPSPNTSQLADMFLAANAPKEDNGEMQNQSASVLVMDSTASDAKVRSEKSDDDSSITSFSYDHHFPQSPSLHLDDHIVDQNLGEKYDMENGGRQVEGMTINSHNRRGSSSIVPELPFPTIRGEIEKVQNQSQNNSNSTEANSDDMDEKAKVPVVQQRGRFKVTSENVDLEKKGPSPILQKSQSMQVISPHNPAPLPSVLPSLQASEASTSNLYGFALFSVLHSMLLTNIHQRDNILFLMKQITAGDSTADGAGNTAHNATIEKSLLEASHDRERELLHEITELQRRLLYAQEELKKSKTEANQM